MILFTIIIPIYNTPKEYLVHCFQSIEGQKFQEYEVILINDGSSKELADFCNHIVEEKENWRILHQSNRGTSVARNLGIQEATGEYLLFVDGDDWLENNSLYLLAEYVKRDRAEIVIGRNYINNGEKQYHNTFSYQSETTTIRYELIKAIFLDKDTLFTYVDTVWGKCYKKDFVLKNQLQFDPELKLGEDGLFNLIAYSKADNIVVLNRFVYHYRINMGSITLRFQPNLLDYLERLFSKYDHDFSIIQEGYEQEFYYFIVRQIDKIMRYYIFNHNNHISFYKKYCELLQLRERTYFNRALANYKGDIPFQSRKKVILMLQKKQNRALFFYCIWFDFKQMIRAYLCDKGKRKEQKEKE